MQKRADKSLSIRFDGDKEAIQHTTHYFDSTKDSFESTLIATSTSTLTLLAS